MAASCCRRALEGPAIIQAEVPAAGALRPSTGAPLGEIEVTGHAIPSADLGRDWIGQKKDKSGKRKAADKDRPVPHVEAKNSTLRHCGDQL
jgi:hypothetical protein